MKLCVIGTGYVGLVAGACLADMGNDVICVDNNEEKLKQLEQGIIPIYEPALDELVTSNVSEHRLKFSSDLDDAVKKSEVCFIAVGTPQREDGSADLSSVYSVAEAIAKAMNGYKVIVDKSTVPVGTADEVTQIIRKNTEFDFDVVSNPEFLKQGNAVDDFLAPDRVIIGSDSPRATAIMQEIYSPYLRTANRIVIMDVKSAEMTKYAANSFLATKISFMNEIATLCEKVGANAEKVRIGMATDMRIGSKFLFPGVGYGGSCFPKDVKALIQTGCEHDCDMMIVQAVVNPFGTQALAGYAATMRVENVFSLIFVSIGNAVSPFVSQNLGAKKIERIKKGYHAALVLDLCFAVLAFVVIETLHTQISSLFLGKDGTALAYQVSGDYMRWLGYFFIFMGIKMATDGVLRGLGIMRPFLIANMVNLAIRLSVALICAPRFGIAFVWLAVPAGWLANFLISYAALRRSWPEDKAAVSQ